MARPPHCDNCDHASDGTLRGRVRECQMSNGVSLYTVDLCRPCYQTLPISRVEEIGRRVGTGHLKGVDRFSAIPVILPD